MGWVAVIPLAILVACGGVEERAADGSPGSNAGVDAGDVDGQGADGGGRDAQTAPDPGDLVWTLSLSAMFGLGVADGPGGLVVTGYITAPTEIGDQTFVPMSACDMVAAGFRASDASNLYAVRHGASGPGQSFGFLDQVDAGGNPMVFGVSYGDVDLGLGMVSGGGGGDPGAPPADGFIGRYGPTAPSWVLRAVGPGEDKIVTTARAPGTQLYAAGWFEGTTVFDGESLTSVGGRDLLLTRLNSYTGATDLVRTYGGAGRDETSGSAGDGDSLILGGFFDDTLAFDPAVEVTATGGGLDVWVAKFDADANPVWAVSFGGAGEDRGATVALAPDGDVYVAGQFQGEIALGAVNLTSRGMGDIFVARLSGTDGGVRWAVSIGTSGDDGPSTLLVDHAGHLVLAATIGGPLDDEPSEGGGEALLVSLDPADSGATRWRKVISTSASDYGWDAAIGASGDVFALMDLGGAYDFGPSLIGPANPTSVLMKFAP